MPEIDLNGHVQDKKKDHLNRVYYYQKFSKHIEIVLLICTGVIQTQAS